MFLIREILPGAIIAILTATGIQGLAFLVGKERWCRFCAPMAIGIGYAAGHLFITGWRSFPPVDTTNWLPYFGCAAAILAILLAGLRMQTRLSLFLFAPLSVCALRLLLKPKFQHAWSFIEGWSWVAGWAALFILMGIVLGALVKRSATMVEVPGFLLIVCGGTIAALLLSGSVLLGQFAAVLGAAVLGSLIFSLRQVSQKIVAVFVVLEVSLLVSGYFFAQLPGACVLLLALAPALALVPALSSSRALVSGIRIGLVSVAVAAVIVVAYFSSPPLDY